MKLRELLENNRLGTYYSICFEFVEGGDVSDIIAGVKSTMDSRIIPYLDRDIVEEFGRDLIRVEGTKFVES